MEIEYIARIGFPSGGTADQQRDGTVGHGVLAQVVIDHQHVFPLMHEVLAHGTAGIGGDVLHRRQFGSGGGYHNGIIHSAAYGKIADDLRHSGALLADGHINTQHILALLVQDGVGGNGGLAGLPVADDQFSLAAANGDHGIDGFDTGLQRNVHRFPVDNARCGHFNGAVVFGGDRAFPIDGLAQRIDHAAD